MAKIYHDKIVTPEDLVRYAHVGKYQAIVYDDYAGFPLKVTCIGDCWWVTTPGEPLQTREDYDQGEDIRYLYLCEAGGTVGALALAKMLGKALEHSELAVETTLHHRIENLKRLGVHLNTTDEPLTLELEVFPNPPSSYRQGKYSAWCRAVGNCYETVFDIDDFSNKKEAEECVFPYFDFLHELGITIKVI